MPTAFEICNICKKPIHLGEMYGTMIFNIEVMNETREYPNGVIDTLRSEPVYTLCMECASKFNNETIKELID